MEAQDGMGRKPRMAALLAMLFILFSFSIVHAQVVTGGGNVTHLNFSQTLQSGNWDGIYGQVIPGNGTNITYTVLGGNITKINLIAQEPPPCNGTSQESMHIIAVNATSLTTPLQAGNLSILDASIPGDENGSASFKNVSSFDLTYGHFILVPTLYTFTGNATSRYFREGYLNDASGNLVFVADVVSDKPDWNGSTSDYQMILPKNGTGYSIFVDAVYSCIPPNPPNPHHDIHRLYIQPVQTIVADPGSSFGTVFIIQNTGDFPENDINVTLQCPSGFICGSGTISHLSIGREANLSIPMTVDGPGEFVLTVCAADADTSVCRDFIVRVVAKTPECTVNGDCPSGSFCQNGSCELKKKPHEPCDDGSQCQNGVCSGGFCSYCISDADCPDAQACSAGSCVDVQCRCGKVSAHACAGFACCADSDCGRCQICSGNSCLDKKFDILLVGIQGDMIEGQPIRVQVMGNSGQGVPGARVYTSGNDAYTDANGYATINVPYDGIIYASADCYPNAGLMISVIKKGFFVIPPDVFVGENTSIRLVDSKGLPIAGATVYVDGLSFTTDSNGIFHHIFESLGKRGISGKYAGYSIQNAEITPRSRGGNYCSYPVILGLLLFDNTTISLLWLLSLAFSLSNLYLFRRRLSKGQKQHLVNSALQLTYSFVPLFIAMVPGTAYGICFVSNVITLQLIIELLVVAWRALRKHGFEYDKENLREMMREV